VRSPKYVEAPDIYARSSDALQLRGMNIIYETTKERGGTIHTHCHGRQHNPPGAVGLITAAGYCGLTNWSY
jgi:hypothetical protein